MEYDRETNLSSEGELSSAVKEDRFARRKVFCNGGPMAEVLEKAFNGGGKLLALFANVPVYS